MKPYYLPFFLIFLSLTACESVSSNPSTGRYSYSGAVETTDSEPVQEDPAPNPASLEQQKQNARVELVGWLAANMIANASDPSNFDGELFKAGVKLVAGYGIDSDIETLYPEATAEARAALKGVLIAFTEMKSNPSEYAGEITKQMFLEKLRETNPDFATKVELADSAWSIFQDGVSQAQAN